MYITRVKLCIHESSSPIPNLFVNWYATPLSNLPKEFLESSNWDSLRHSNWKGLNGFRLGSAYTKEDGVAHLEYDQKRLLGDNNKPLNLWFIIQSPEIAGAKSCGQVVYASCQITSNPSNFEELEVRFPVELFTSLGLGRNLAPKIDSKRSANDFKVQLKKIENGATAPLDTNTVAFSKTFNERIIKAKKLRDKNFGRIPKAHSFNMKVVVKDKDDLNEIDSKLSFDRDKKSIVLKDGGQQLLYKGVSRFTKKDVTDKERGKPFILIDKNNGGLQISLPKVPDDLELSETKPTELFQFLNINK